MVALSISDFADGHISTIDLAFFGLKYKACYFVLVDGLFLHLSTMGALWPRTQRRNLKGVVIGRKCKITFTSSQMSLTLTSSAAESVSRWSLVKFEVGQS